MNKEDLKKFAEQGFNRVPVMREILADLETPLGVYLKLANKPYSYLFESVQDAEKWGRYSIIGLPCRTVIKVTGDKIIVQTDGKTTESLTVTDPLEWVKELQQKTRVPQFPDVPVFTGGLVGYFGYETVRYIEPRLNKAKLSDPLGTPDILLMVSEDVVVFDNLRCRMHLITHVDPKQADGYEKGQQRLNELIEQLQKPYDRHASYLMATQKAPQNAVAKISETDFQSSQTFDQYKIAVNRAKQYIDDGDVMQVVYSRRITIPYREDPIDLYRVLRSINPSPYMYYLHLSDFYIVGSSPEILVRLEGDTVTLRPIAGTRRRGKTEAEDQALEKELLADKKELAEHLMLIDLGRNDVGRIAQTGSVKITNKMKVERYSHVMHIVSNVIGKIKSGMSAIDVLRATFPAGTLSGAPKVRAMEIIDELESAKRNIYSGAVGYLGWNGNLDTAIAIRTAVIKDGILTTQAGGGLVADSVPEDEWQETQNKAMAIMRAVMTVINNK